MKQLRQAQVADHEGQKPHCANWTEKADVAASTGPELLLKHLQGPSPGQERRNTDSWCCCKTRGPSGLSAGFIIIVTLMICTQSW